MRRFLRPLLCPLWAGVMPGNRRGLLGIGVLLAGPRARGPVEAAPSRVVDALLDRAEDRALDGPRQQEPAPRDVAVLRVRRLLVVDHAPDPVEAFLPRGARHEAGRDRHGDEQELGHSPVYTRRVCGHAGRVAARSAEGGRVEPHRCARLVAAMHAHPPDDPEAAGLGIAPPDGPPEGAAELAGAEAPEARVV